MPNDFDVIIIGSGPAGVSAAFPLVQAGLKILMVDGGKHPTIAPPISEYLSMRGTDSQQWKWMVGEDFHALKNLTAVSPKLRTPTNKYVFDEFETVNKIISRDFVAVGSLASGGLSNAWGCGVARLSENELAEFPFQLSDIERSYEIVSKRIGISGCHNDDLSDYFGLDDWAQPPIKMDPLHTYLFSRYRKFKNKNRTESFRIGRSRIAVLSQNIGDRKACDILGNCLWGCNNKALYSAVDDLALLKKHDNFVYKSGFVVENIRRENSIGIVEGFDKSIQCYSTLSANKVFLAAGILATTRLALKALNYKKSVSLLSCPTAAFLLWMPRFIGTKRLPVFGLGQLSFNSKLKSDVSVFGSTFSTTGIPVSEFVRYLPFSQRFGIDFLRYFLSSCVVGNAFLPGNLSSSVAELKDNGDLIITGGYKTQVPELMGEMLSHLRKEYWQLGAILLPRSFTVGGPGGDIHYAGTLPMQQSITESHHTNLFGELNGISGIHIVDGACLSALSEKSHTLTIMANADRIGRELARQHYQ